MCGVKICVNTEICSDAGRLAFFIHSETEVAPGCHCLSQLRNVVLLNGQTLYRWLFDFKQCGQQMKERREEEEEERQNSWFAM